MYQKSYSLSPSKELYQELNEIKPVDKDLDLNNEYFKEVCLKEGIPTCYDTTLEDNKLKLINSNEEYKEYLKV
jgi:hypothetical protein